MIRVSSYERIYKIRDLPWANLYKCSKSLSSEIFREIFRIISQFWKIPGSESINSDGGKDIAARMQERGEVGLDGKSKSIQNCFDTVVCFVQQVVIKQEEWLTNASNYELGICRFTENITGTGWLPVSSSYYSQLKIYVTMYISRNRKSKR